jgi:TPR repeat protein
VPQVERDLIYAMELYRSAAEQGVAEAMFHLASILLHGFMDESGAIVVQRDELEALRLLNDATLRGHPTARKQMGVWTAALGRAGARPADQQAFLPPNPPPPSPSL